LRPANSLIAVLNFPVISGREFGFARGPSWTPIHNHHRQAQNRIGQHAVGRDEEIDAKWFWDAAVNKRLNGVPLPKLAQRVLHPRQQQGKVFGGIDLDRLQAQIRKASGITDFIWHGVRHLAETKTAELRDQHDRSLILPHIRDLLFDHVSKRGAGKDYDHHDYIPEMRAAMEAWAEYIERLVKPGSVALLR
jgi:hypothetical protein